MLCQKRLIACLGFAAVCCVASRASAEFTTNGDFETGTTAGWQSFPTPNSIFNVTSDAGSGSFAGEIFNPDQTSAAVVKQANIGKGSVTAGETIMISFSAKGEGVIGGVAFAEFFSEIDGGGISAGGILGGAPLALTNIYQDFQFTAIAGPDVSGGVTLQFAATTGANAGSQSRLFIDNVSVTGSSAVPEPATFLLLALCGGVVLIRHRERSRIAGQATCL